VEDGGTVSVEHAEEAEVLVLPPLADQPRKKKQMQMKFWRKHLMY
jgi:hypothetical protein